LFIDKGFNLTISLIYPAVFYGATFVGMTSEKVINHWGFIILGTLVYSIIYSFASVTFKGFGGGLGTMASFSVLFAFAFQFILNSLMKKSPDANLHKK
jgi:hypothetical protein